MNKDNAIAWAVCPDTLFQPAHGGMLASNHRTRSHVWVNQALLGFLLDREPRDGMAAVDMTQFNDSGLLEDPTCLNREEPGAQSAFADAAEAVAYLGARFIVVTDPAAYEDYLQPRTSLLDQRHLGTFHQRLGAHLLLKRRVSPDTWWYEQKFDPATGTVREGLYRYIQQKFLDRFFAELDVAGKTVLDFGCGSGMASQRFAQRGARVVGVDPDPVLLERARVSVGEGFQPCQLELGSDAPLRTLPDVQVDMIWMSDVFMFYFYPLDGRPAAVSPQALLSELASRLVPGGRCVIMQPHGMFWLSPWLGTAGQPMTVLSEYADRLYSVAPSLQEMSDAIAESGLVITRIHEPLPQDGPSDSLAVGFASQFPQWWVFECMKLPA